MDIEAVYSELIKDTQEPSIKVSWIERFVDSPITFWCDVHAPLEARDTMDLFQEHLFEAGQQHQLDVTETSYPGAIQEIFLVEEDGFWRTLELLSGGEQYIKNMPLIGRPMGLEGRPDLLVRTNDVESELGPFSYQLVEIKSARRIRKSHILQAAAYNRLLGHIQGYEPREFYLVNGDGIVEPVLMAEVDESLDVALATMRDVLAGAPIEPCYGAALWPWKSFANQMAIDGKDVSLLPGIGPVKRADLVVAGFSRLNDVAAARESALTQIKGIGSKTAKNLITAAQALVQDRIIRRAPNPEIPSGSTEVFFDFEGTDPQLGAEGLEVTNYLIGTVWRTPNHTPQYLPFFAPNSKYEKDNLNAFIEWAHSLEDPVFFHWRPHERTHFNKMGTFYELDPVKRDWVTDRMVDLSPYAVNTFAFPCYGQGLKDIAKSIGFNWRQDDVDGLGTVVLFFKYVESGGLDVEAKEKILVYNEDDCYATMHVFDWLISQEE